MTTSSTTHYDTDRAETAETPTGYQGRHMRLDVSPEVVEAPAPTSGSHPRRRGFGILSRLAKVDPDPAVEADVAPRGAHAALVDA